MSGAGPFRMVAPAGSPAKSARKALVNRMLALVEAAQAALETESRVRSLAGTSPPPSPASPEDLSSFERRFRTAVGEKMTPEQVDFGVWAIREAGQRSASEAAGLAIELGRVVGVDVR